MQRHTIAVTIANGQSLSGEVNVGPHRIVGIQMPAGWTAGDISAQALLRQVGNTATFGEVVGADGNNIVVATGPAADEYIAIADTAALQGLGRIKLRSGTAAIPVAQGAERVLTLVLLGD